MICNEKTVSKRARFLYVTTEKEGKVVTYIMKHISKKEDCEIKDYHNLI